MSTVLTPRVSRARQLTLDDLADRFGPMPLSRIRMDPLPGKATEKDVLRIFEREDRLCELVDGILVEKDVGYEESRIAGLILTYLKVFVLPRRLGSVTGEAGMLQLGVRLVRIPDVAFVSRKRLPGGKAPTESIPRLVPNLAVEVLSRGNTVQETARKLREYFHAGVELVWLVDPRRRTVEVFKSPKKSTLLTERHTLSGGRVLPGFELKLRKLSQNRMTSKAHAAPDGPWWEQHRAYLRLLAEILTDPRLKSKVDLSGVVQQVLLEAHAAPALSESEGAEQLAWLRRALANNLTDEFRKLRSRKRSVHREVSLFANADESSRRLEWLAAETSSPSAPVRRHEQALRLAAALERLPAAQREALILQHWHGCKLAEIAERLGKTRMAVAGLLKRGLEQLRDELGRGSD